MKSRGEVLDSLVTFDRPIELIKGALATFPWDHETTLVTLTRRHVRNVLERYQHGELGAAEIEEWASAIEGRDDVGFEDSSAKLMHEIVHRLANPLLSGDLTPDVARELIAQLRAP